MITLKIELVNAILQYLANQPYAEVYQLINAVSEAAKQTEATQECEQPEPSDKPSGPSNR